MSVIVLLLVCAVLCTSVQCFGLSSKSIVSSPRMMTMEYIPDGLTKAQWKAIKQKVNTRKFAKRFSSTEIFFCICIKLIVLPLNDFRKKRRKRKELMDP